MEINTEKDQTAPVLLCGTIYSTSTPPLVQAATLGNTDLMKQLLSEGADPNCCNDNGQTPLHVAARNGHQEATQLLLQNISDTTLSLAINAIDKNDNSPLHLAAGQGHAEAVQLLLSHGADAAAAGFGGRNALHAAALEGHDKVVELLLRAGGMDVNTPAHSGYTPLHSLAYLGHQQLVRRLLQAGARADSRVDVMRETPLHLAARRGHAAVVSELLTRLTPAAITIENRFGETALELAAAKGHLGVVQLFVWKGSSALGGGRHREQQLVRAANAAGREGHMTVWATVTRYVLLHCPEVFEQCLGEVRLREGITAMAKAWGDDVSRQDQQFKELVRERQQVEDMRRGAQELVVQGALLFKQAERMLGKADATGMVKA
jgi:ankyrin repeat protein